MVRFLNREALGGGQVPGFVPPPVPTTAFRAIGTGIKLPVFSGGATNQSVFNRLNTYSRKPVKRVQFGFTPFYVNTSGGTVTEVRLPQPMKFQIGVDENFTQSMTVAPRGIVKWGGQNTGLYDPATSPYGVIPSDVYEFATPRTGWISIFTTLEWVGTPPSAQMPRNVYFSNTTGQYGKSLSSSTSLIDAGWAHTVTDLGAETANGTIGYIPFMVAEMVDGTVSVLAFGTSSTDGIGDFTPGSGTYTNPGGDQFRNRGWVTRAIDRKYGHAYANLGASGDQLAYLLATNAFRNRLELTRWLNPSHCAFQHGANDVIAGKTVAEVTSMITQAKALLRSVVPGLKYVPCTMGTYSTSTGNWTASSGGDQQEALSGAYWTKVQQLEADMLAGTGVWSDSGGKVLDVTTPTLLPGSRGLWKTDGITPKLYTPDGRHNTGDSIENLILPSLPSNSPFN